MSLRDLFAVGGLAVALVLAVGCSEGSLPEDEDADGGERADTGPAPDADTIGEMPDGDTGPGPDPDADGGDTQTDDGPPPVEAFTTCGAGGVSSGSGIRAVQCYGPAEVSGSQVSSGGVTWQPGSFRVISEP